MAEGHLAVVLHAHLPFVRHPEHDEPVEERWLHEAIAESYLPLLGVLRRLAEDGVPSRLTLSITPPLVTMLRDDLLVGRATRHLDRLLELAAREAREAPADERPVARFYLERLEPLRGLWESIGRDLPGAFSDLARHGVVELLGSPATHAFLPLLVSDDVTAVRAQVEIGLASHARAFGIRPKGMWLPECGWDPRLDPVLADAGVTHVVVDSHGLLCAKPPPSGGVRVPIRTPAGVAVFARDPEASWQVWSAEHGYPAEPDYRDFYRDVGYERRPESLGALAHPLGVALPTGLKYRRIGDRGPHGSAYDPEAASARTRAHATDFLASRARAIRAASRTLSWPPGVVAPYDAELFGHWWFEGPEFLERVLRGALERPETRPVTLEAALRAHADPEVAMPEASSWGEGGYSRVWCNASNSWMASRVRRETRRLVRAARTRVRDPLRRRALDQAAREVLLGQSSDWPFLVWARTAGDYPRRRFEALMTRAARLLEAAEGGPIDEAWLTEVEARDNVFSGIEVADVFAPPDRARAGGRGVAARAES